MDPRSYVLITGGAGFLGSNLAHRLLSTGERVVLFDNLSHSGSELNLLWLRQIHESGFHFVRGDIRDRQQLREPIAGASAIFHLAAQTSPSCAAVDPRRDFEINAGGTLNVLEEGWRLPKSPKVIFASSSRVYGTLDHLALGESATRYEPLDWAASEVGIGEDQGPKPAGMLACSKAAAEGYTLQFARGYGMQATSLRLGTVYGPHQFGDDGCWVTHFVRSALEEQRVEIYGNGKQVRDILFVDDAVDALVTARDQVDRLAGRAFNVGGGPKASVSLLELIAEIRTLHGHGPHAVYRDPRPADPRYFVSDISAFRSATGWEPKISVRQGLRELYLWVAEYEGIPAGTAMAHHASF